MKLKYPDKGIIGRITVVTSRFSLKDSWFVLDTDYRKSFNKPPPPPKEPEIKKPWGGGLIEDLRLR